MKGIGLRLQIGCFEMHLNGTPWAAEGDDAIRARLMILSLLQGARQKGFKVQCTWEGFRDGTYRTLFLFRDHVVNENQKVNSFFCIFMQLNRTSYSISSLCR